MNSVADFLKKNKAGRAVIHVFGDSMLDQNYDVKVTRISPESPNVCVMLSDKEEPTDELPGGAANICYQLANFNTDTKLFTFVDNYARSVFTQAGLDSSGFIGLEDCLIPRKKRFFQGGIQVKNRWDIERPCYGLGDLSRPKEMLAATYAAYQSDPDVIILSDYDKGFFKDGVPLKLNHKVPTIVDPKKLPLERWRGCTIFKPNAVEAANLSGHSDWRNQCDYFKYIVECQSVVITQEGEGVVGKDGDKFFEYRPTTQVDAQKIIGAGDCFIGILGLAVAHRFPVAEAAEIAFEAGAAYVQSRSRKALTPWLLQRKSKFVTAEDLKDRDYKLVFTNGCFDIIHSGHLESLRFAKSKGDRLAVAVNSDESVARFKGPMRPVVPLPERMQMLAALEVVDYVLSFEEDSPLELIKEIRPDVLIKGSDWKHKGGAVGSEYAKEVCFAPLVEDRSTTNLIEKIRTLVNKS